MKNCLCAFFHILDSHFYYTILTNIITLTLSVPLPEQYGVAPPAVHCQPRIERGSPFTSLTRPGTVQTCTDMPTHIYFRKP